MMDSGSYAFLKNVNLKSTKMTFYFKIIFVLNCSNLNASFNTSTFRASYYPYHGFLTLNHEVRHRDQLS